MIGAWTLRGEEGLEAERRHRVDEGLAVLAVARAARGGAAFGLELVERRAEGGDDVGGRREAPLRRLLHVGPLVVQVHRQRMGIAFAVFEQRLACDHEPHAGRALDAFARSRDHGIDGVLGHVDFDRAERAHGVHDEALAVARAHRRDLRQRVQDAGPRLAMHLRHVSDRGIHLEGALEHRRGRVPVFRQVDRGVLPVEILEDLQDALAIGAVLRHEHLALARHEIAERRLHGEGAAALQRDAHVAAGAVDDIDQVLADRGRHRIEGAVPRAPIAQHRLLGLERGRERPRREEDRVVSLDHEVLRRA